MRTPIAAFSAAAFSLLLAACTPSTIPGTPVEDTKDNRAVLSVIGKYQADAQALDADAMLQLASPKYFDKSFMARGRSPVDYEHLQKTLTDKFAKLKTLKMEITIKDVRVKGDRAEVDYFLVMHFAVSEPTGEKWFNESDDERMTLARENNAWKVVAGL